MAILKRSKKSILGLDTQLVNIETNIATNGNNLSTEITNRTSGDENLQIQLNTEKARTDILVADITTVGSVDYKIDQATGSLATATNVYTKSETNSLLDAKVDSNLTLSTVSLANKVATQTELSAKADANNTYSKTETETFLDGKADISTTYTKTEVDTVLANKANTATTYTKTEVNNLVSPKANSADVYTKTEIDTQMGNVLVDTDTLTSVTSSNKLVTESDIVDFTTSGVSYTKSEIDTQMSGKLNTSDTITVVSAENKVVTENELSLKANNNDIYTKLQIDSALSDKANTSSLGKIGPSLNIVDETNIGDNKVMVFKTASNRFHFETLSNNIDDTSVSLIETWSSDKISNNLTLKANVADVYTKTETDSKIATAAQGIEYTVATVADLNNIVNPEQNVQALVNENRYIYKYDSVNGWVSFYALDAVHDHDDMYYTETEIDNKLNTKADTTDVYTKTQLDGSYGVAISDLNSLVGKIGPSFVSVAETTKADHTVLEYQASTDKFIYTSMFSDTSTSSITKGWSTNKLSNELTLKANVADVYTKTETDSKIATAAQGIEYTVATVADLNNIVNPEQNVQALVNENRYIYKYDSVNGWEQFYAMDVEHDHDDMYYTETEIDNKLNTKADTTDVYTKSYLNNRIGDVENNIGTIGDSTISVNETYKSDNTYLVYNATNNEFVYTPVESDINDSITTADNVWSAFKVDTLLGNKANTTDVYTKSETDNKISAASKGIEYTVDMVADLATITGMVDDAQALVNEDRYVYKYDTVNGWEQYYAMDASHDHNDIYYTETEIDNKLNNKADAIDVYTKTEIDNSIGADVVTLNGESGKVGPSFISVDETNKAGGHILSYNSLSNKLEYVANEGNGSTSINDSDTNNTETWSSNKISTELGNKADSSSVYTTTELDTKLGNKVDSSSVYTTTELDTKLGNKVNTSDVLSAITVSNKVVTEADISGLATTDNVYTKTETDTKLAGKADDGDSYTKAESDNKLLGKLNTTDTVTAVSVGNKIITQNEIVGLASTNDVYTKTETDNLLTPKFDNTTAVSNVDETNKIVTETELATKVNVSDVKTTISVGNKVVTESDVAAAITASESSSATAPELVVDRPTLSVKSTNGLDYVFEFSLSKTPHGTACVGDEITIYDYYENGDATVFENVSIFGDKHGEISVTLGAIEEANNYTGKTIKITYLSTDTATVPGTDVDNPIIINAGVDFELQGSGTTDYNLDFSAGSYYRVVFTDGYYTNINHDTNRIGFHTTNTTDYQAFNYTSDDTIKTLAWVGQTDEAQYITYNWIMSFANVSGATYKVSFTRGDAVGGGGL